LIKVCIDASLAIAWLSYEKYTVSANALRQDWLREGVELLGPPIFHAEVMSVLRQQVFFKKILPEDGEEAFSICLDIPIRIIGGPEVYSTAWRMAKELDLPVCYDTQYLAVAELEDCEFWTTDRKLVNLIQSKNNRVRWLGEYGKQQKEEKRAAKDNDIPNHDIPGLWREI
jgi:predicted nucleic acid-binding protein